jgi:hypothetical protein
MAKWKNECKRRERKSNWGKIRVLNPEEAIWHQSSYLSVVWRTKLVWRRWAVSCTISRRSLHQQLVDCTCTRPKVRISVCRRCRLIMWRVVITSRALPAFRVRTVCVTNIDFIVSHLKICTYWDIWIQPRSSSPWTVTLLTELIVTPSDT